MTVDLDDHRRALHAAYSRLINYHAAEIQRLREERDGLLAAWAQELAGDGRAHEFLPDPGTFAQWALSGAVQNARWFGRKVRTAVWAGVQQDPTGPECADRRSKGAGTW